MAAFHGILKMVLLQMAGSMAILLAFLAYLYLLSSSENVHAKAHEARPRTVMTEGNFMMFLR
jgi:hypothetical protein